MAFQIHALSPKRFAHLFDMSDDELLKHHAKRLKADKSPCFPCRVSLRDAEVGETLIIVNHTHHDHDTPYRASHAVFVIENVTQAFPRKNGVPEVLRHRLLSLSGFNIANDMVDADVVDGRDMEAAVMSLFANPEIAFIHVHNAKQGCYAAQIVRA